MNNIITERFIFSRIKNHINNFLDKKEKIPERFIIIFGLSGSGKTTLLKGIRKHLINKKIPENMIIFESLDNLKDQNTNLKLYINHKLTVISKNSQVPIFLLLDDVDRDPGWDLVLKNVYENHQNVFIITTSSSTLELETKISSNLAGCVRREYIFPLNFIEYLKIVGKIDKHRRSRPIKELLLNLLRGELPPEKFIDELLNYNKKDDEKIITYDDLKSFSDEFENFLKYGGFPHSALNKESYKDKLIQTIEKILSKDIPSYYQARYGKEFPLKDPYPKKILSILVASSEIRADKLSMSLGVDKKTVENFLDILEKAFLIFSVKPLGSEKDMMRKLWKYYFITPTIRFMIKISLGTFNDYDIGLLLEDQIASSLYKITKTYDKPKINFFYDPSDYGGVDFLIKTRNNEIIPIEVKYRTDENAKKQVEESIGRYKAKYGIIIGDYKLKYKNNILYIPKELFSIL